MSDHMFNVCYGVGKVACDRMASDCAFELRQVGVTMISLWPGPVNTESIAGQILEFGHFWLRKQPYKS